MLCVNGMLRTSLRRRSLLVMYGGLVAALLSGWGVTSVTAGVVGCRADPIVKLSDGTVLDITADINTDVAHVTVISYVVHGPPTTSLIAAITTPTIGFTGKEYFKYIADAPANTYITETLVHTKVDGVRVISHTTFANVLPGSTGDLPLQYKAVTGLNGEVLRATLRH